MNSTYIKSSPKRKKTLQNFSTNQSIVEDGKTADPNVFEENYLDEIFNRKVFQIELA